MEAFTSSCGGRMKSSRGRSSPIPVLEVTFADWFKLQVKIKLSFCLNITPWSRLIKRVEVSSAKSFYTSVWMYG